VEIDAWLAVVVIAITSDVAVGAADAMALGINVGKPAEVGVAIGEIAAIVGASVEDGIAEANILVAFAGCMA
jgi:hypothetical protein